MTEQHSPEVRSDAQAADAYVSAHAARLDAQMRATGDVLWWTDAAGQFVERQPDWERFTGQSFEEYRGSRWVSALHPDDRDITAALWSRAVESRSNVNVEYRLRRHDGEYRRMRVAAAPVLGPAGELREWVGIETDITEQRARDIELDAQRARLQAVFRDAPALIALTHGPEHRFELVNPAYEATTGNRPLLDRPVREAFPELEGQPFFDLLDQVYRTGQSYFGREVLVRIDRDGSGELVDGYFDFTYQPVRDGAGEVTGLLTFAVDVTAQVEARRVAEEQATELEQQADELQTQTMQMEEIQAELEALNDELRVANDALASREAQFRTLAESIPQLAWIARPDGHIFWYNQRWYDYTGTTPDQMEGWGWQSVHDPDVLPRVIERWQESIATGMPFDMEFPLRGADGEFRWFLTRVQPVRDDNGKLYRWFGTNTDVDDRRRALDYLAEAREQADAANRGKSAFLAHMSHELRTPINAIVGYAELLELGVAGELSEEQLVHTRRIVSSSQHLLSIINDILDLTKIEAGAVEVRRGHVDISDVVRQAVELVEPIALAEDIRIEPSPDAAAGIAAEVDADRVRQVLVNLLVNAVKFSADGASVAVRVQRSDGADAPESVAAGPLVRIDVIDRGAGIEPEHQERIFEPFFQVDSGYTRAGGGTGLGLTISRRLTRAMGGDLTVESQLGQGSTFTLWLPAA